MYVLRYYRHSQTRFKDTLCSSLKREILQEKTKYKIAGNNNCTSSKYVFWISTLRQKIVQPARL